MTSVALIELGGSHDECLYAQAAALKFYGAKVILVTTASVAERVGEQACYDDVLVVSLSKGLDRYRTLWRLNAQLKSLKLDRIVLNTATGGPIKRLLTLPNYPSVDTYGILHDIKRLQGSVGQQLIGRRVKGYLVLADYLATRARELTSKSVSDYYCFEQVETPAQKKDISQLAPRGTIRLCVPGQVSDARRDYEGLLQMLAGVEQDVDWELCFLGRADHVHGDGAQVRAQIDALGLTQHVTVFSNFISAQRFKEELDEADYLLPLIHPGHRSAELYDHQITGTFNLAYGRRKTMLMHSDWQPSEDFADTALSYDEGSFAERLKTLATTREQAPYQLPKWDARVQQARYLRALGLK